MGARGWFYFVPYQPDINKALQELRQQVFERGEYYGGPGWHNVVENAYKDLPDGIRERLSELYIERQPPLPEFATIEALLEWDIYTGTHCILDIHGIADDPSWWPGKARPLTDEELISLVDTTKPDHSIIEERERAINTHCSRGHAIYIIVYKDGVPDEVFFTGVSGD